MRSVLAGLQVKGTCFLLPNLGGLEFRNWRASVWLSLNSRPCEASTHSPSKIHVCYLLDPESSYIQP